MEPTPSCFAECNSEPAMLQVRLILNLYPSSLHIVLAHSTRCSITLQHNLQKVKFNALIECFGRILNALLACAQLTHVPHVAVCICSRIACFSTIRLLSKRGILERHLLRYFSQNECFNLRRFRLLLWAECGLFQSDIGLCFKM
jgi:hypothetical protein